MLLASLLAVLAMFMPVQATQLDKRTFWADDGNHTPFVGCFNTLSLWTTILNAYITNQSSGNACAAFCQSKNFIGFSYWERSTGICKCALGEPGSYLGVTLFQNGYGRGNPGNCPSGYWDTRVLSSKYQFKGCVRDLNTNGASFNSWRDRLFFKAMGVKTIFKQGCANNQFLVTHPTTIGIFSSWYCYGQPASGIKAEACDQSTYYVYSSNNGPVPSGLRRRAEPSRLDQAAEQDLEYLADQCNQLGHETCYSDESREHWECVDTNSEKLSCGGCRWGSFKPREGAVAGQDCTPLGDDQICVAGTCRA